jgi:hypothetical protein
MVQPNHGRQCPANTSPSEPKLVARKNRWLPEETIRLDAPLAARFGLLVTLDDRVRQADYVLALEVLEDLQCEAPGRERLRYQTMR